MPLLTALEDFIQRSLSPLPTVWEKFRFVSDLREASGSYRHWGLEQKFGEAEAQKAVAESHAQLAGELAAAPLAQLWLAASQAAQRSETKILDYLVAMDGVAGVPPANLEGIPAEHVRFVISSLSRVARCRSASTPKAA